MMPFEPLPPNVEELYRWIEARATTLVSAEPVDLEFAPLLRLQQLTEGLEPHTFRSTASTTTLYALSLGMVAGVDEAGSLLLAIQSEADIPGGLPERSDSPQIPTLSSPDLCRLFQILESNLAKVRDTVRENWSKAEPDDLFLLREFGKHENLKSMEEGEALALDSELGPFQKFLVATYKGGFALGAVHAAWAWQEKKLREGL